MHSAMQKSKKYLLRKSIAANGKQYMFHRRTSKPSAGITNTFEWKRETNIAISDYCYITCNWGEYLTFILKNDDIISG